MKGRGSLGISPFAPSAVVMGGWLGHGPRKPPFDMDYFTFREELFQYTRDGIFEKTVWGQNIGFHSLGKTILTRQ